MTETGKADWAELLRQEAEARLVLGASREEASVELHRAWWGCLARLLDFYVQAIFVGPPPAPAPWEALLAVKGLAGHLAVGDLPGPVGGALKRGRTGLVPLEAADVGMAVAFRKACREEGCEINGQVVRLSDPEVAQVLAEVFDVDVQAVQGWVSSPIKTLGEWFGVSRTTVQGWVRADHPTGMPPGPVNPEIIVRRTRAAGARYRANGRSRGAVADRGKRSFK